MFSMKKKNQDDKMQ